MKRSLLILCLVSIAVGVRAEDSPFPADAVKAAHELGAKASKVSPKRPVEQAPAAAVAGAESDKAFQKFLAIKQVDMAAPPDGKPWTPAALESLMSNFRFWEKPDAKAELKPASCLGPGDYCSSSIWCCGSMLCSGGVCSGAGPTCIPRGRPCSGSIWCCGAGICNDYGYCQ